MKKLRGKDKTQAALETLDRLTKDEGLSAVAQTLGIVHGIADDMRVVMGGMSYLVISRRYLSKYLDGNALTGGIGQNLGMCLAQKRYHPN